MARIVFLQNMWFEYLGLESISAVLKQHGHGVSLFIGKDHNSFAGKIKSGDIVAFYTITGEHHWVLETANSIKKNKDILVVLGGPHPTYFPEIIKHPAVDIVCRGEGEYAMLDIANTHDKSGDFSSIQNLVFKQDENLRINELRYLIPDLDALPFYDRNLYYAKYPLFKRSYNKRFLVSRGCYFSCSFCYNEKLRSLYGGKGKYVRFRSPQNIIEEIKHVEEEFGVGIIEFTDDVFTFNKDWLREFCCSYKKEVNKPFICNTNVLTLDEETVSLLKGTNCQTIFFGIESGNEEIRKNILNKHIANYQIEAAAKLLKKYKIKFATLNIIASPQESLDNAFETVDLNVKIGTNYPYVTVLVPYPNTRIAEQFKEEFKLDVDSIQSFGCHRRVYFRGLNAKEMLNLHYFFQTAVIFPWLRPIIRRTVYLPTNIIFKLWWIIVFLFVYTRATGNNLFQTFSFVMRSFRISHLRSANK